MRTDKPQPEEILQVLSRTPVENACALDLLIFLSRHPRTLLTSEQLAGFVGYNLKEIAKALDGFIDAGLLERTAQQSMHAARMFVLLLDGRQGGGVRRLLEIASTRQGRQSILEGLKPPGSCTEQPGPTSKLRLMKYA